MKLRMMRTKTRMTGTLGAFGDAWSRLPLEMCMCSCGVIDHQYWVESITRYPVMCVFRASEYHTLVSRMA